MSDIPFGFAPAEDIKPRKYQLAASQTLPAGHPMKWASGYITAWAATDTDGIVCILAQSVSAPTVGTWVMAWPCDGNRFIAQCSGTLSQALIGTTVDIEIDGTTKLAEVNENATTNPSFYIESLKKGEALGANSKVVGKFPRSDRPLVAAGALAVAGAVTMATTLAVTGATTLGSTLGVTGATTLSSTLGVTGATTLSSTLGVTGVTTLADDLNLNGTNGAKVAIKEISEEVTIAVGAGAAGQVTSGNLAPANSLIVGVSFRVTQAPGGGATTLDIGRTGGGNLDEFIDGATCTTLGNTGNSGANHDAVLLYPPWNVAAATLTLTTNSNVTGTDMKVRVSVHYLELTAPTS